MTSEVKYYTLKELCEVLSVSYATGRNWIKTGKIIPSVASGHKILFDKKYTDSLIQKIKKSKTTLKSRRNKKYASGNFLYKDYIDSNSPNANTLKKLIEYIENNNIKADTNLLLSILVSVAEELITQKYKNIPKSSYRFLLSDLSERKNTPQWLKKYKFKYIENEDTLGFIYISLNNIAIRKASGSYYTPANIVKKLCSEIFKTQPKTDIKILDPCCGSGNFLINLPSRIDFENIYGSDTDAVAVKLARINMFLKFGISDKEKLYSHFKELDFIFSDWKQEFDYIIGNPPWAFEFSKLQKEKLKKLYKTAQKNTESYDIVTEKALHTLKKEGKLSFVLPEAILNVKAHKPIRQIICTTTSVDYIEYLGEVFNNVQCPSIILTVTNTQKPLNSIGTTIKTKNKTYKIQTKRKITPENFSFTTTDEEYKILNKINNLNNKIYLKNNSTFALGIVTGDNKKYLQNKKTQNNEIIIKGTNIVKYGYKEPFNYIEFENNKFQQVAPVELYRAKEKLLYKFISRKPIFCYDNKQRLTLNSCNILIPRIKDMAVKYILAILNSSIAEFYLTKTYNSAKLLRSHIESIPIPFADKATQNKIKDITDKLSQNPKNTKEYKELDKIIGKLYNMTKEEYSLITNN